jgi:endoribonuclease Dicer
MAWVDVTEEQDDYFSADGIFISDDELQSIQNVKDLTPEHDEDSDVDADIPRSHGAKTTSEKRRAQNEVMRAFAANISAHVTQKEVDEAASKSSNEEQLSIRNILAGQATNVRITNPRDYQTELFQRAKTQNTIAVLDTGTGKTHIATLLLRHVLEEELENRSKGCVHKIAFFLVSCRTTETVRSPSFSPSLIFTG